MGPLTLPDLKLSTVELKGRLAAGRFVIETGTIGKPGDELYGTIKGKHRSEHHQPWQLIRSANGRLWISPWI